MKNEFKKTWKSSKKVKNQRKYRKNAPLHLKRKLMSAHLSKELKEKYNKRSAKMKKGDKVKIMRGSFKGKTGIIEKVETKREKIYVTGIEIIKKDGTKRLTPIAPSNLLITSLDLEDKKRISSLERKK
ncbi:50S ribosomal protein L24 [Candidatus Woesearchaeota archaeon]|nr:50S ribosomal protein L24 [Candidatus Woesearchaeota archaeon]MBL7050599.1 50S ribosomal protein L24 [Candidatus Woesearchaeota archaeon]